LDFGPWTLDDFPYFATFYFLLSTFYFLLTSNFEVQSSYFPMGQFPSYGGQFGNGTSSGG